MIQVMLKGDAKEFEAGITAEMCIRDSSKIRHIIWWRRVDSNHRSKKQQIYSLSPLATRELPHIKLQSR